MYALYSASELLEVIQKLYIISESGRLCIYICDA